MTTLALHGGHHESEPRALASVRGTRVESHSLKAALVGEASAHIAASEPEQRVLRQLVEALLFEHLVDYKSRPRVQNAHWEEYEAVYSLQLDFRVGAIELSCLAKVGAFDRVRIAQGSIRQRAVQGPRRVLLVELLAALEIPPDAQRRLHEELEQTVAFCRWNEQHLTHHRVSRRGLAFQQLESAIVEGHQYHPCFKARTGFSLRDHQDYGPEAGNTFQLQWLAVDRSLLRVAVPGDEARFWQQELGEGEYAALCSRLVQQGGDLDSCALLPVHPWQLHGLRTRGLDAALDTGTVRVLGAAGDRYHASQSLRTLVNVTDPTRANVKLPLDIVCTSTHRNLESHFVCTAPALSDWLISLVEEDPFLQARQHLLLLREYAGVICLPEDEALQGRLGVLYRESINAKLAQGEAAVPFTALTIVEADGRPFIDEWVTEHGVERWVARLLDVMLIPIWHMLVHHGVAFESHAQNLILVHRAGWPEKIVLRDFHEDTEFVPDYLRAPDRVPDFAAIDAYFATVPDDDGYRMASTDALRELFMDCVYVYNLADLSFLLERFCGYAEAEFWDVVRAQLDAYARSGVTARSRIDRVESQSPSIVVESLLKKKVEDGQKLDFFEHQIRNTLHG